MPYADQSAIELAAGGAAALRELADWDGDGTVDASVIASAQAAGDGWIDSYLRARFATPVASPSATLVGIAADEAVYVMRQRRRVALDTNDIEGRKQREAWLVNCAKGLVRPDEPLPAPSTAIQSSWVEDTEDRAMSREGLKGSVW